MRYLCGALVILGSILSCGCGSTASPTTGGAPKVGEQPKTQPEDSKEHERLKGTWQVTAITAAGKPVPADRVQKIGLQYIFDGNKVTVHRPDRTDNTNTFTVDGSASPKKLTINSTPAIRAIYAFDGNKLQLCTMVDENPNAGYPTELASKANPKTDLLTLERR